MTLDTHIALVMHRREVSKPSNTGGLALLLFTNSRRYVRGLPEGPADLSDLNHPERRTWLLFPSERAEVLSREMVAEDARPITLVVPDGTWAQTRRAVRRETVLDQARHVLPPPGAPTRYRLRREHTPGGLATAEALARALGIIEGEAVQTALEGLFDTHVDRVLGELSGRRPPR